MPLGLWVLTFAAFAIGTSEFIIAGILPNLASDFDVGIPTAGLLVTAYAASVAVGGPILAILTARLPRKPLIVVLLAVFSVSQVFCALAPSYFWLMMGRVFSACSHGLFFGAGSVAAINLVAPQRRGMAMALFLGGITIANLMGVPAGTAIGDALGWRWSFWAVGGCGLAAALSSAWLLPAVGADSEEATSLKDEFDVLRHQQVYLSYLVIVLVMVGSLVFVTYQVPLMIEITGIPEREIPIYLVISGIGAILGIYAGGRFADWRLMASLVTILLMQSAAAGLLLIAMPRPAWMGLAMFLSSAVNWLSTRPCNRVSSTPHAARLIWPRRSFRPPTTSASRAAPGWAPCGSDWAPVTAACGGRRARQPAGCGGGVDLVGAGLQIRRTLKLGVGLSPSSRFPDFISTLLQGIVDAAGLKPRRDLKAAGARRSDIKKGIRRMEYRRLGASGLKVPVLTFGTGTFAARAKCSRPGAACRLKRRAGWSTSALKPASNMFDSADVYSAGESETVLAGRSRAGATRC